MNERPSFAFRKFGESLPSATERAVEKLMIDHSRLRAQVLEALAILKHGTDYERLHVAAILEDGL